jgi:2-oxo-4-hydroxy-4-carboxy--5-ureidoimidazoline (OHCU) decarboxylase
VTTPTHDAISTLFEGAPRFVDRLDDLHAPTWLELFGQAEWIALTMPEDEQLELINAHPRIGAEPTMVSALSYREQGYDVDPGTAELQHRLDRLNDDYERTFGFRFCVFVNGRSRAEIAEVIEQHLDANRTDEKVRALRDVIAIARSRAARLAEHQEGG